MRKVIIGMIVSLLPLLLPVGAAADAGKEVRVEEGVYRSISPAELSAMLRAKDFFLVDVHVPYAGEIPKTDAFISYEDTAARIGDYPRDKAASVVVYCLGNRMSGIAVRELLKMGYTNLSMLDGGMNGWRAAGFPLIQRDRPPPVAYPSASSEPAPAAPETCGCSVE
jgi:rhodanese-related sulfurtransferase